MLYILDACALIAYLQNEPEADAVEGYMMEEDAICFIHAVNLCEVYYDFLKVSDARTADSSIFDAQLMGLKIREDADMNFVRSVGHLKTQFRASLADCFAAALAKRIEATLLTKDRKEFTPMRDAAVCPIQFLR